MGKYQPELVGILNYNPDSFSDGGLYYTPEKAVAQVETMFGQGASIVDVGAESTRPDATPISPEEEYERLQPLIEPIVRAYSGHISIDTHHHQTVRSVAAQIGSFIINDVTGFNNPRMIEAAAELQLPVIASHLTEAFGQDIQAAHKSTRKVDSVHQVIDESARKADQMIAAGIRKELITLDPGIGFNKTMRLNWELTGFASCVPEYPVMIGYSRKRFLHSDPETGIFIPELLKLKERATGPGATPQDKAEYTDWLDSVHGELAREAAQSGAKLLRVHDVAAHRQALETHAKHHS